MIRFPLYWLPDFRVDFRALESLILKQPFEWLQKWWFRSPWSRFYFIGNVRCNQLGYAAAKVILEDGPMDYRRFSFFLFILYQRMKSDGWDIGTPFLWGDARMFNTDRDQVFVIG